jgi:two-component sensor histidine kinase
VVDQLELRLAAKQAVQRAELMAREIDHRVTNSLQFVSGVLAVQSRSTTIPAASALLQEAATRVAAVGRVHRNFYSNETAEVPLLNFLARLCSDLSDICGVPVEIAGEEAMVPSSLIQPLGLLTNELVTNAAKHGGGKVIVSYRAQDANSELSVCDQGPGLDAEFDPTLTSGLGMKVVKLLTKQLGGELATGSNRDGPGACFSVRFVNPSIANAECS